MEKQKTGSGGAKDFHLSAPPPEGGFFAREVKGLLQKLRRTAHKSSIENIVRIRTIAKCSFEEDFTEQDVFIPADHQHKWL